MIDRIDVPMDRLMNGIKVTVDGTTGEMICQNNLD
jgi:hypothetical protein